MVEKKVKVVGRDTQANDQSARDGDRPATQRAFASASGRGIRKWWGGRDWKDDFPEWEPLHRILFKNGILGIRNVGGKWTRSPAGVHVCVLPVELGAQRGLDRALVAIVDPSQKFRIKKREMF